MRPALAEIDELKARLDEHASGIVAWEGQLRRDREAAAVHASVAMEGVPVTVEEVRRVLADDRPQSVSPADAELVSGYRKAMGYVQARAEDPDFEWSPELLKAVQHEVLAGRKGTGRYGDTRYVYNETTDELIFTPPQTGVSALVAEACDRMNVWKDHPALRAAWIHVAVAAIHPFKDGNGRTARILASLAMYEGGFKRPEFCSLEEWWGNYKRSYYDAFRCLGESFDPQRDVTTFIKAHVDAQRSQVRALELTGRTNRQIWTALTRLCERRGLPDRAMFALWAAYNGQDVTRPYYRSLTDISETSATSDFNGLRTADLLLPHGETRGRRYTAGPNLYPDLARELDLQNPERADRRAIVNALTQRLAKPSVPAPQTIHLPSIPSAEAWGTPTVTGWADSTFRAVVSGQGRVEAVDSKKNETDEGGGA